MLNRVNKFGLFIYLLLLLSCQDENKVLQGNRELCFNKTLSIVSQKEYLIIYNKANDSIKYWISNYLAEYLGIRLNTWRLDPLICFNHDANKCVMAILIGSTFFERAVNDEIDYFYGVKIKTQWFFFQGGGIVLPREYYQKDIHTPLSFEKMKQLAMKNIFQGYLKKSSNGQLEVNEAFFGDLTSVAWCVNCTTQAQWDSAYLAVVRDNWKKRDNTDYDPNQ